MLNFMKIGQVGAELFHEERRTDTTNLTVAVHNLTTPLKIPPSAVTVHGCVVPGYWK
jgi:hypothetical protein